MSGGFGRLLGGLAGAFLGSFIGQPALGFSLGSALFGSLFAEDTNETVEGPRIDDLSVQASSFGKPLPIIYGAYKASGNVIWMENNQIKETKNVQSQTQGKGGPSKTQTQVTFTYSASFAVSIAEGPIAGARRVWADSVLILDNSDNVDPNSLINSAISVEGENVSAASSSISESIGEFGRITIYKGTSTQKPHPRIQADRSDSPAYRNTAYLVFEDMELERFGNRLPQISVEVVRGVAPQLFKTFPLSNEFGDRGLEIEEGVIKQLENITIPENNPIDNQGVGLVTNAYYEIGSYELTTGNELDRERVPFFLEFADDRNINKLLNDVQILQASAANNAASNAWVVDGSTGPLFRNIAEPLPQRDIASNNGPFDLVSTNLKDGALINGFVYALGDWRPAEDDIIDGIGGNERFIGKYRSPTNPNPLTGAILSSALLEYKRQNRYFDILGDFWNDPILSTSDGRLFFADTKQIIIELDLETLEPIDYWSVPNLLELQNFAFFGNLLLIADDSISSASTGFFTPGLYRLNNDHTVTFIGGANFTVFGGNLVKAGTRLALFKELLVSVGPFFEQDGIPLASIIDDLASRAGVPVDTSQLTETVKGYAVTKPMPIEKAISSLRPAFRFDGVENNYQIQFKPRELSSIRTLTEQDLSVVEEGQDSFVTTEEFEPEVFLPRRLRVQYLDINTDYERGAQYAGRIVTNSEEIKDVNIAVVLDADEAVKTADIILKEAWTRRVSYSFNISMDHVDLLPGDVVDLDLETGTTTVRIQEIDDGAPGIRKCKAVRDGAFIYSSESEGETGLFDQSGAVRNAGPTRLALLDIPMLRDQDDNVGFYLATGQLFENWSGANILESTQSSVTFEGVLASFNSSVIGSLTGRLGEAAVTTTWDDSNSITVNIPFGDLESKTESEVLEGANLAAVSATGGWELVQFTDVVDNGDNTFTLSHMLRGRLGTEWATALHSEGGTFVLLENTGGLSRLQKNMDFIGQSLRYKAVTFGTFPNNTPTRTLDFESVGKKPWSPVHITGARDGSDNLTVEWIRRARFGGGWRNGAGVPNTEDTEAYEIDIVDSNDDVVRTLSATSTSVTYTATDQTTDFGSVQPSISVRIYQMSDIVGRGYRGEAIL